MLGLMRAVAQLNFLNWLADVAKFWLLIFLAWQTWQRVGPGGSGVPTERQQLAHIVVNRVADDLAQHRGEVRRVVLPVMAGDFSHEVTDQLRATLERRGVVAVAKPAFQERVSQWIKTEPPRAISLPEAGRMAVDAKADATLLGHIDLFEMGEAGGRLCGDWTLVDPSGRALYKTDFDRADSLRSLLANDDRPSWIGQLVPVLPRLDLPGWTLWLVLATLLPIISIDVLYFLANDESSRRKIRALLVYSSISTALAIVITDIDLTVRRGIALSAVVFAVSFCSYVWALSRLVDTPGDDR